MLAPWASEPPAVRVLPATRSHPGIPFATIPGRRPARIDLHVPEWGGPHPVVVYAHGGSWTGGRPDDGPWHTLPREGIAVASVAYRLGHEVTFPEPVELVRGAHRVCVAAAAGGLPPWQTEQLVGQPVGRSQGRRRTPGAGPPVRVGRSPAPPTRGRRGRRRTGRAWSGRPRAAGRARAWTARRAPSGSAAQAASSRVRDGGRPGRRPKAVIAAGAVPATRAPHR